VLQPEDNNIISSLRDPAVHVLEVIGDEKRVRALEHSSAKMDDGIIKMLVHPCDL